MDKITIKGFWAFAVLCAYVVGAIGSIGYAFYANADFVGVCSILLSAMAIPYVINAFKEAGIIGNKYE